MNASLIDDDHGTFSFRFWVLLLIASILMLTGCKVEYDKKYRVTNSSMAPTLVPGDSVLAKPFDAGSSLNRFQLVVVSPQIYGEQQVYIKRVIGLPGEDILIETNSLVINGKVYMQIALPEALRNQAWFDSRNSIRYHLQGDEIFVIGDNLRIVNDSRSWGPLRLKFVVGVVRDVQH
jgi:signal peptidase I